MLTLSVYPISPISYTHDPSAALLSDKEVLFAYEEEKIIRLQHALATNPKNAAVQALQTCGAEPGQIGRLVITSRNFCGQLSHRLREKVQFLREVLLFGKQVEVECVPHHLARERWGHAPCSPIPDLRLRKRASIRR